MATLDDRLAKSLPGPEDGKRECTHWDDLEAGLGIRVLASGRRSWIVRLRVGSGQRFVTLGDVRTIPAKKARSSAGDLKAKARLGDDPRAEIEAKKKAANRQPDQSFRALAELYLERDARRRLRPRSYDGVRHSLLSLAAPFHGLDAAALTRRDVAELVQRLASSSGARAADLAGVHLSGMFNWSIASGILEVNPASRLPKASQSGGRDRVLPDAELANVWRAADPATEYGVILRLLILTGQRREEIGGLRWDELRLEEAMCVLPATRTKNKRWHEVPLSDQALAVLRVCEQRRLAGREHVFGTGRGGFQAWSICKARLDEQLGDAVKRWRVHDLRRTVVTGMVELGVLPHVVEAVVNHVSGHRAGVAGIYNRASYAVEKRDAMARWGEHVEALAAGRAPKVTPLRARVAP